MNDLGRTTLKFWESMVTTFKPNSQPTNNDASTVWCLGKHYRVSQAAAEPPAGCTPPQEDSGILVESLPSAHIATPPDSIASSYDSASISDDDGWPTSFLDDFESRISLTYRSNFCGIPVSKDPKALAAMSLGVRSKVQFGNLSAFTSDTGWGCMIRSSQSLLANTLLILKLGRDWRRGSQPLEERKLLSLFADDSKAPYSLHKFVEHGAAACGKYPGVWFGPSAAAQSIQALSNDHEPSDLRVYITGDGSDVYEESFMSIAKPDGGRFHPTLILVGTRLGLDKITPVYWEALKAALQMPQSVGIAGGRPSSSHYFVGVQGDYFFYLDPHETRPALPFPTNVRDYSQQDMDSCHTRRLRRIHVRDMDPSMLIGFLIHDENEWKEWRRSVREVQGKAVIHVADKDPARHGVGAERDAAIDEVESFDDSDDDTILNA